MYNIKTVVNNKTDVYQKQCLITDEAEIITW